MSGVAVFPLLPHNGNATTYTTPSSNRNRSFPFDLLSRTYHTYLKLTPRSSITGSAADYSEPLLDADKKKKKKKKKRKSVSGIEQDELLDPFLLADPDSCFCEFKGVQIHHKVYDPYNNDSLQEGSSCHIVKKKHGLPLILLHGFGASVFSWSRVMMPLAEVAGSKVIAFDRPAFGLTSRVEYSSLSKAKEPGKSTLNPYSMTFSVLATLSFIDLFGFEKAILVGHSAGSLVAVDAYFEAPERVAALILVAPAILAPITIHKTVKDNNSRTHTESKRNGFKFNSLGLHESVLNIFGGLVEFTKYIAQEIMQMVKGLVGMINSLYKKALLVILRSALAVTLVRVIIDKFGIAAIRNAWYDGTQVTNHVLNGYTKPLRVKGWDRALTELTASMLVSTESQSKVPLSKRLHEISCPVLIVTGDNDRLVPSWNAEKLAQAIPGSQFEVIKHCGHLPHEEKVEEFVKVVENFLQIAFGDFKDPSLQVAI